MTASFAIVVVAYHRPRALDELLHGIGTETEGDGPAVVVVNVEADPVVASVASACGATVVDVDNRGYAAAVNLGVSAVTEEIVVFMNDDVAIEPESLRMLAAAVERADADVVVPRIVDAAGREEGSVRALPTPTRLLIEWAMTGDRPIGNGRRIQKWRRPRVTEPVPALNAVVVATRTSTLRRVPLPEDYFLYWEELDWCWQLRATGLGIAIVPAATVVHRGGRGDVRPEKQRLLARNAVRCVLRTQGRGAALRAWPVVVLWQCRLLALDLLRTRHHRPRPVAARVAGVGAALMAWREVA